jgi:type IV fimbrial biogenesis protein FimT
VHRQRHLALLALSRRRRSAGFTLLELMVAIAIVAILATIAVPSFQEFARSSRLTSVTNNLVGAFQTARTEAMKRNRNVMLQPIDGTNWSKGWIVFVDTNFNNSYAASEGDILISRTESTDASDEIPSYVKIEATGANNGQNYAIYDGSGFSKNTNNGFGGMTLQISRTDAPADFRKMRRIMVSIGRVRSCIPASDTDPACLKSADAASGG